MNFPNKLTITRIILAIIIVILLLFPYNSVNIDMISLDMGNVPPIPLNFLICGIIFIIASFTDYLDGHIARKYGYITNTGKIYLIHFIMFCTQDNNLSENPHFPLDVLSSIFAY